MKNNYHVGCIITRWYSKGLKGMYTIYIGIKEESNHLPHSIITLCDN